MEGSTKPFSLDTVLNYKKRRKDEAGQRLVQAIKNKEAVAQKLANKLFEQIELSTQLEELQNKGIDIQMLILYEDRIEFLKHEADSIEKNLKAKERIVDTERNHLIACAKEHKILSQLKEKQNNAWRQHLSKKEASILDEVAVTRYKTKE